MATDLRKTKKKTTAPPDFGQPGLKWEEKSPDFIRTPKIYKYDIETITQRKEDLLSYVKPLPIVRVWRRKMRSVIIYSLQHILNVEDEDESWILPYEIVNIQRRNVKKEERIDEVDNE